MELHELTLAELLDDPMTIAVMAADQVDPVALKIVLSALSRKFQRPEQAAREQIGFACYAGSLCHRTDSGAALR